MKRWKDSRWLPRACVLLYVAMFVIVVQLAWGCADNSLGDNHWIAPVKR